MAAQYRWPCEQIPLYLYPVICLQKFLIFQRQVLRILTERFRCVIYGKGLKENEVNGADCFGENFRKPRKCTDGRMQGRMDARSQGRTLKGDQAENRVSLQSSTGRSTTMAAASGENTNIIDDCCTKVDFVAFTIHVLILPSMEHDFTRSLLCDQLS